MEPTLEEIVKTNLTKFDINPDPNKGQHFLVNRTVISYFYREVSYRDIVIEIGPGFGQITQEIVKKAKEVIAIEVEKRFIFILKSIASRNHNLQLIFDDVLPLDLNELTDFKRNRVIVLGNLPYQIIEPLFLKLIILPARKLLFITGVKFAKEIQADAESSNFGKLTLLIRSLYDFEIITQLPSSDFYPQPVTSSVLIKFTPKLKSTYQDKYYFILREIILSAVKGKKLKNVLRDSLIKYGSLHDGPITQNQASDIVSRLGLSPESLEKAFEQSNNSELKKLDLELNRVIYQH